MRIGETQLVLLTERLRPTTGAVRAGPVQRGARVIVQS
jgi:hypothetical protein